MEKKELDAIEAYIYHYLGLSKTTDPDLKTLYELYVLPPSYRPDLLIKNNHIIYCVEIKNKANIDSIARINLYSDLIRQKVEGLDYDVKPFLAIKTIDPGDREMAVKMGIEIIKLPWDSKIKSNSDERSLNSTVKITSEKSWRIVSAILKEPSSIRSLSKKENVSYGWAHKTVQTLLDRKIAEKNGYLIRITDSQKLLNGVAWERPMKNLMYKEIYVDYSNSHEMAISISQNLDPEEIQYAFTGLTAGGLYSGYAFRHDFADMYIEKSQISKFLEILESNSKTSVKIRIYLPDRDVFSSTILKESVRLVSPEIALLDLAGMGYQERDITNEMLKYYGKLHSYT